MPADPSDGADRTPPWLLLLRYTAGVRLQVAVGGLLALLGSIIALAQPLLAERLITTMSRNGSAAPLIGVLIGAVLIGALLAGAGSYLLERSGETVVLGVRIRLARHILRLHVGVLDTVAPGDLVSRMVADTTMLRQITTQGLVTAGTAGLSILGGLVFMGFTDLPLLLVTIGSVAVAAGLVWAAGRGISRATGRAQAAVGSMAALLDRLLGAFRTVKAAGAEPGEERLLAGSAREAWRAGLGVAGWQAASGTVGAVALQATFLAVLGVGGARVASGAIEVSTLVTFMLFVLYLNAPILSLITAYHQYRTGVAAAARVEQVMDLPAEPAEEVPPPRAATTSATVRFDEVTFGYAARGGTVHDGLSFVVPAGGVTALVGPSGAGKSTVFALLERFYEVSSGRVLVDGADVRDVPLAHLRGTIGYVEQDTPVLAGTVRENLTLGLGPVPDERLHEVLALTRLDGFVRRLPGGLDGGIGHRGSTVSGGERQRLAIARALLRSPRLLLLDEATSQLDAANEQALRDCVASAAATTTVVVIAHRLSTVVDARQIVVLEDGRARASGTHTELLATDELYRELAANQLLTAPEVAPAPEPAPAS